MRDLIYLDVWLVIVGESLETLHLVGGEGVHGEGGEGGEREGRSEERRRKSVPVEVGEIGEILLFRERLVRTEMIPSRF